MVPPGSVRRRPPAAGPLEEIRGARAQLPASPAAAEDEVPEHEEGHEPAKQKEQAEPGYVAGPPFEAVGNRAASAWPCRHIARIPFHTRRARRVVGQVLHRESDRDLCSRISGSWAMVPSPRRPASSQRGDGARGLTVSRGFGLIGLGPDQREGGQHPRAGGPVVPVYRVNTVPDLVIPDRASAAERVPSERAARADSMNPRRSSPASSRPAPHEPVAIHRQHDKAQE
jgi:hypothetical protein